MSLLVEYLIELSAKSVYMYVDKTSLSMTFYGLLICISELKHQIYSAALFIEKTNAERKFSKTISMLKQFI